MKPAILVLPLIVVALVGGACALDWPQPIDGVAAGPGAGGGGAGGEDPVGAGGLGGGSPTACDACPTLALEAITPARTLTVAEGADLQAAIDEAQPGDEIVLEPGASYDGVLLPDKLGRGAITVRTADLAGLSTPCTRIGTDHLAALPKIIGRGGSPAVVTDKGHDWRFVGVELSVEGGATSDFVVKIGSELQDDPDKLARRFHFDRVYLRGDPVHGSWAGIWINAEDVSITNSRIADLIEPLQSNVPIHAIILDNSPGGLRVINNHLESAWAQVIVGGGTTSLAGVVPTNIEIQNNHLARPERWLDESLGFSAQGYHLRQAIALYNARDVTVEANVIEHVLFQAAVELRPERKGGARPWATVEAVRFTNNELRDVATAFEIHASDDTIGGAPYTSDILIANNLAPDIDAQAIHLGGAAVDGVVDLRVVHNTLLQDDKVVQVGNGNNAVAILDNVLDGRVYGIYCENAGHGLSCLDSPAFASWEFDFNLMKADALNGSASDYPQGSNEYVTDLGFVAASAGDYRLLPSSDGYAAASDGKDMGVDFAAFEAAAGCRSNR